MQGEKQIDIVRVGPTETTGLVVPVAARIGVARAVMPAALSGALPRASLAELLAERDTAGEVKRDPVGRIVVDEDALLVLKNEIVDGPGQPFTDREAHRLYSRQAGELFPALITGLQGRSLDQALSGAPTLNVMVNNTLLELEAGEDVKGAVVVEFLHSVATGAVTRIPGFNPALMLPLIADSYAVVKELQPVNDQAISMHAADTESMVEQEANFRVLGSLVNTLALALEVPEAIADRDKIITDRTRIDVTDQLGSNDTLLGEDAEVAFLRRSGAAAQSLEQLMNALRGTTANIQVIDALSRQIAAAAVSLKAVRDDASGIGMPNQSRGNRFREANVDQFDRVNDRN